MSYRIAREDDPDGPWPIFDRVLDYPELHKQAFLASLGVRFAFVFRLPHDGWTRGGKTILGTACMPGVTGSLSKLFDQLLEDVVGYWPDFLITLNADYWEVASELEREILVFHELKHCGQAKDKFGQDKFNRQTGAPVIGMIEHDVEEFDDVVARYGAWKSDIASFLDAVGRGPAPQPNSKVRDAPDLAAFADAVMASVDGHPLETVEDAKDLANRILGVLKIDALEGDDLAAALEVEGPRDDLQPRFRVIHGGKLDCDNPTQGGESDDVF